MTSATILTMANGKGIDLLNVRAEDIDFVVIAEHLAKEKRFNGATPGCEYSVAQHLCLGGDAMAKAGATDEEVAYFLIHDAPEAFWKDDPTPKKVAIATRIAERCGVTSESVLGVHREIDAEHEAAVHQAAGLPWPIPEHIHKVVKLYDAIMFVTEWRDVMNGAPHPCWHPFEGLKPLDTFIDPWPWDLARPALIKRFNKYLPALRRGK